jgi:iron complex outermembrane receptor protein
LLWTPGQHQTIWAGISRAVRTPSRAEEDVKLNQVIGRGLLFPNSPVAVASIYGNRDFNSEVLTAYEIGYRVEPIPSLSVDVTAFYNVYDDLRTQEMGPSPTQPTTSPPPPPNLFIPLHVGNGLRGDTYGVELAPSWQVTDWWRLRPSYSLLKMQLSYDPASTDVTTLGMDLGTSPQQQFSVRSSMDLPCHLSFDWTLRYVDRLSYFDIGSYFALDVRLGWRPTQNLEFAVVGQNLLSDHHAEFAPTFIGTQRTEVPESVYVQMTWRFGKQH